MKYISMVSAVLMLWSCNDPFKESIFKAYDEYPVGMSLKADPDYSMWVYLLKKADLYNALNLGADEFTCFVAKNDVVEAYLLQNNYATMDDIPQDELEYLMRYHIISGKKYQNSDLLLKLTFPTVSGDYLTAGVDLETELRFIDNGEGKDRSYIIEKDMRASNGIIQSLSALLQPITTSLWDLIDRNPSYTIFKAAIQATGFEQWLDRNDVEINNVNIRDMKSVFVVPDAVFQARGINDFEALKSYFGDADPSDEKSGMYQYMLYHFFEKLVGYSDLTTFPKGGYKSMIYYTMSERKGLSILDAEGKITFNPDSGEESFHINDACRDVPASNGYLHEIDNLGVLPETMSHFVVSWEPTDRIEFRTIPFYRTEKVSGSEPQTYSLVENELEIKGIRWEAIPDTKAQVWYTNEYANNGRYLNSDALHWNLGNIGWLEFDIPVIPLGKYRVDCEKYNTASDGGKGMSLLDDQNVNDNEINFATGAGYANWKTFTFVKEETHTIRFNVGSASGIFGVDRFVFTPME